MASLTHRTLIESLPGVLRPLLPASLQGFQSRIQWQTLLQIHYGEPALHYEVSRVGGRPGQDLNGWELGFHCEARDHALNRFLLDGFRRNLFEIKEALGEGIEAEMWDRGWTKIYEVYPQAELTDGFRLGLATRLAALMTCLHPIFVELRRSVVDIYR